MPRPPAVFINAEPLLPSSCQERCRTLSETPGPGAVGVSPTEKYLS